MTSRLSWRLLAVLFAVICYSSIVLVTDDALLPAIGVDGSFQVSANTLDALGGLLGDRASPGAGTGASGQPGSHSGQHLSLLPFGIHRPGTSDVWWLLASAALFGVLATVLLFLFPRRIRQISNLLEASPLSSQVINVLLGLIVYLVTYVLLRLSWLTVIGMPVIPLLIDGVWILTWLGLVAVSFSTGHALLRKVDVALPAPAEMLFGLWLLLVTCLVPYLGWVVAGTAAAVGLGAVIQTRFGSGRSWSLAALNDAAAGIDLPDNVVKLRRTR